MDKRIAVSFAFVLALLPICAHAYITGLSYTNIKYDSTQKLWLIDWSGGGTDYISGYITPSDFKSQTGYESKQKFSIKMESGDEYAKYYYYHDPRDYLKEIELVSASDWAWVGEKTLVERAGCVDISGDGAITNGDDYLMTEVWGIGWDTVWCAKWGEKKGDIYRPNKKEAIWTTKWTFSAEGKTPVTRTLSNDNNVKEGISTIFGDGRVRIKWYGSLSTLHYPPEYSNVLVLVDPYTKRIIDADKYQSYKNYVKSDLINCIDRWARGGAKESCELAVHNRINSVYIWTLNPEFSRTKTTIKDGYFKLDLDEGIQIPKFQVIVDADYLEVVIPYGEPAIGNIYSYQFKEDEEGDIYVEVKNIGNGEGDFELRTVCTEGFSAEPTKRFTLSPKSSVQEKISIYGHSDIDPSKQKVIKGTCTVYLKERTTGKTVSKSVAVSFIQSTTCEIGSTWKTIDPKTGEWIVLECVDGYNTKEILRCPADRMPVYLYGKWECGTPTPPPTPTPPTPPTPPAGTCEEIRDSCLRGCGTFNIPCIIGCYFEYFGCWITRAVTQFLILVGAVVVVALIIYAIIRFATKPKVSPIPFPPFGRR